jgi:hypothetical protein
VEIQTVAPHYPVQYTVYMTTVYYYTSQSDGVYESRAGVDGLGVSNEYIMWYQHAWVSLELLR